MRRRRAGARTAIRHAPRRRERPQGRARRRAGGRRGEAEDERLRQSAGCAARPRRRALPDRVERVRSGRDEWPTGGRSPVNGSGDRLKPATMAARSTAAAAWSARRTTADALQRRAAARPRSEQRSEQRPDAGSSLCAAVASESDEPGAGERRRRGAQPARDVSQREDGRREREREPGSRPGRSGPRRAREAERPTAPGRTAASAALQPGEQRRGSRQPRSAADVGGPESPAAELCGGALPLGVYASRSSRASRSADGRRGRVERQRACDELAERLGQVGPRLARAAARRPRSSWPSRPGSRSRTGGGRRAPPRARRRPPRRRPAGSPARPREPLGRDVGERAGHVALAVSVLGLVRAGRGRSRAAGLRSRRRPRAGRSTA